MSVTSTWGAAAVGARDQLVVVAGDADDLEVGLHAQQRPDAFADDHVVVGEEDGDRHLCTLSVVAAPGKVARAHPGGGAITPTGPTGAPLGDAAVNP